MRAIFWRIIAADPGRSCDGVVLQLFSGQIYPVCFDLKYADAQLEGPDGGELG